MLDTAGFIVGCCIATRGDWVFDAKRSYHQLQLQLQLQCVQSLYAGGFHAFGLFGSHWLEQVPPVQLL